MSTDRPNIAILKNRLRRCFFCLKLQQLSTTWMAVGKIFGRDNIRKMGRGDGRAAGRPGGRHPTANNGARKDFFKCLPGANKCGN